MSAENLKLQIDSVKNGQKADAEDFLQTIQDIGVDENGERVQHCDFIWGRRYLDEVGEDNYIDRIEKPLPRACKEECKKVQCTCWTWSTDTDGKTVCDLKDEANCQVCLLF